MRKIQTVTVNQVAAMVPCTAQTVYKALKEGRIKGRKLPNGEWRIDEHEAEKYAYGRPYGGDADDR